MTRAAIASGSDQNFDFSRRAILAGGLAMAIKPALAQGQQQGFTLPALGYANDALAPVIDAETMQLHHDRHHAAYVEALNRAIEQRPALRGRSIEALLGDLDEVPENIRQAVRNNGGGHANHTMFWQVMRPGGAKEPQGALKEGMDAAFGSFDRFMERFTQAGTSHFGSGWVFLTTDRQGRDLRVETMPNQDNPAMRGRRVVMGNDLWEHAYYLSYRNRRPEYLQRWFEIANWTVAGARFDALRQGQDPATTGSTR